MIFYYKNKESYLYPSREKYEDELTQYTYKKHYEYSDEDSIIPSLKYIMSHNLSQASCIVPIEDLCVNYSNNEDIDKNFCDEHNISYFYLNRKGGAIVFFPGNIAIDAIFTKAQDELPYLFRADFISFLKSYNINVEINNNDIMVDNKKIAGLTYGSISNEYAYLGVAISINSDINLINQICTKPMVKIPGALSDYGITTDAMIDWILEWFDKYQYIERIN